MGIHRPAILTKAFLPALALCLGGTGCAEAQSSFILSSSAFRDGSAIPSRYTCQGQDVSPPLTWEGAPAGTRSLVLVIDDPDAPDPRAPRVTWVHWVVYNLPPETRGLVEGAARTGLPPGTAQGRNGWGRRGYGGPCPPIGRHRYFLKLYALDNVLAGLDGPTQGSLEQAMRGHVIGKTQLVGTYEKD
jgi:Raf kinase inhibitor-like YbhB/YbcL family protein